MGGVVVLVRWCKHLSGARYLFMGMILPQLGGNGGMGAIAKRCRLRQIGFWGGQVSQLNAAHAFFSADYPIKYISNFFTQLE